MAKKLAGWLPQLLALPLLLLALWMVGGEGGMIASTHEAAAAESMMVNSTRGHGNVQCVCV